MKHLQTKHEKNSAKITTLLMLILTLCLFVVGQNYKEEPEEYGVAVNFGSPAPVGGQVQPNKVEDTQEETVEEEVVEEEEVEEETVEEEVVEEETVEDTTTEEAEQKEQEEADKKALEEEKLLREEAELAEKLKKEEEAKEKAEAEAKATKEAKLAKDKAEKVAKAKADKEAKEAKARAAAKAKAAKAAADAKALADAKAAAEAKAIADGKAKAAAAGAKKNNGGSGEVAFSLIENAPIYPGCEGGNNTAKKKCMSKKIKELFAEKYDKDLASDLVGTQRIIINFKINTSGNVVGIRIKAVDPRLKEEAKRVTNLLPKMKPGMQQGKPVVVRYGLPINIEIK